MTQAAEVIFYTKEKDWAQCIEAKRFFAEHNISFIEKDVVQNQDYMRELVNNHRVMSVPAVVIDGTLIVGFKPDRYKELLGI